MKAVVSFTTSDSNTTGRKKQAHWTQAQLALRPTHPVGIVGARAHNCLSEWIECASEKWHLAVALPCCDSCACNPMTSQLTHQNPSLLAGKRKGDVPAGPAREISCRLCKSSDATRRIETNLQKAVASFGWSEQELLSLFCPLSEDCLQHKWDKRAQAFEVLMCRKLPQGSLSRTGLCEFGQVQVRAEASGGPC